MDSAEGMRLCLWVGLHTMGILLACLTRLPLTNWAGKFFHLALPVSLVLVAANALQTGGLSWIVSGATLGTMVLASVWEGTVLQEDPLLARLLETHK